MKATILTIGDEILIGQIVDTNSAWIGSHLNDIGIDISEILSVNDSREGILSGLERACSIADLILVTGGLGPTKDDITKSVLAEFVDDELVFSDENFRLITKMFDKRNITITPAHKAQCFLPSKATLIENKMGTAPGMLLKKGAKTIISMPGVPYEMKYIMEHGVIPIFRDKSEEVIIHRTIRTAGMGESNISVRIEDIVSSLPPSVKIAYLPSLGNVRLRLTAKGAVRQILQQEIKIAEEKIVEKLHDLVYGYGLMQLEQAVGVVAKEAGVQLSFAESCTGGHIAHKITSVAGSSAYFQGGIVAYSNELKQQLLGVSAETIATHGAVSEQTVSEMLSGVLKLTKTDIGAAVSGIAGPTGGSPEKPVGTIWIAYGSLDQQKTVKLLLGKDRIKNIEYTTTVVLNMVRKFIMANK